MTDLVTEVTDYEGGEGIVEIKQLTDAWRERAGLGPDPHISFSVKDGEDEAVVYPSMEQAAKIVTDILSAMREAKHGPQDD